LWNVIHQSRLLEHIGLVRFDPWLSYGLLIAAAMLAMKFVQRPAQNWIRNNYLHN
jgi:hypothetical protein